MVTTNPLQFQIAKEQFELKRIRAPIAGIIVDKFKEIGESVQQNDEDMFRLISIDQVYLQVYLETKDLFLLKPGQIVSVQFDILTGQQFKGTVNFIEPQIDGSSGLFRVKILIPNPNHTIISGLRGFVVLP